MSNHRVTIIDEPGKHRAFCVCRASSSLYDHKWQAEDWRLAHLEMVQRVRTHLSYGRDPGLRGQRDYFRSKANDLNTPAKDRTLWKQLADELDQRLNDAPHEPYGELW